MAELNERDAKSVRCAPGAHTKEAELEADLTAHITPDQEKSSRIGCASI